jgi:hypothetical protein
MPPKKGKEAPPPPVEEQEPAEPEEPAEPPEPPENLITELVTGLQLGLRPKDVSDIWTLHGDFPRQAKLLTELLALDEAFPAEAQRDIVCDFHLFNLTYAKSICLSPKQGATFHAIMATVLAMMKSPNAVQGTGPQDMCGAAACLKEFQELILRHSINAPPDRLGIFKSTEARMLTTFASSTLFKHFLLYQFCTNFKREVQTLNFTTSVEKPMPPPDLNIAELRPKKKHGKGEEDMEQGSEAVGGVRGEGDGTEDEEVERLIEEKLREYQEKWEAMYNSRKEKLEQREKTLAESTAGQRKPSKTKK